VEVFNFRSHSFTLAVPIGYKPERERERERETDRDRQREQKKAVPLQAWSGPQGSRKLTLRLLMSYIYIWSS